MQCCCIGLFYWGELREQCSPREYFGSSLCSSPLAWLQPRYDATWGFSPSTRVQLQQLGVDSVFDFSGHSQSQSQSYFTIGCLPPIISSWRQVPWDPWPEISFQLNSCGNSPYITSSLNRKISLPLIDMLGLSPSAHFAHTACYWKILSLPLHAGPLPVQALPSRLCLSYVSYATTAA
jgi:hypothetical protein